MRLLPALAALALSCAATPKKIPTPAALPDEGHLQNLRRLTQGGQNAEAYWSFDGTQLSFQSRPLGNTCDRIYTLRVDPKLESAPVQASSGKGATTCSHFLPGGDELIYASTHLGGDDCPPKPDRSQGYVWALYKDYDIFKAKADGTGVVRLTDTPGYDAEGTVCAKDGSIVFTSVRDGDIDLYRMDRDGKNVRRLTSAPGYDGGAFFNADCSKIVWRASRPKGKALEEYQRLLAQGLVKPDKLEIWVANADGTDPVQVTYLDSASFAPFFFPNGKRILFSSNYGDPQGRDFDLWAVNVDGTQLERITTAPGFDGFPMFSPDGRSLAFASNRAFPAGSHETDLYLADWIDTPPASAERAPDRIRRDIAWLADPLREGRGIGTGGLQASGDYLIKRFHELGLEPAGDEGTYRQSFEVPVSVRLEPSSAVSIGGVALAAGTFVAPGFSASGTVDGTLVFAGYGISDAELGRDDYKGVEVKGHIAVVRRFVPEGAAAGAAATGAAASPAAGSEKFATPEAQRRFGDLRYKAWAAREHGAKALLVVDWPEGGEGSRELPQESPLPAAEAEGVDAGIPVIVVKRAALAAAMPSLLAKKQVAAHLALSLTVEKKPAFNVVGRVRAGGKASLPGTVLIGAHYDHLGLGGHFSLAPDRKEPHLGADDNASGVATVLEAARTLTLGASELKRDVLVVAFSGEESGVLGSTHFARSKSIDGVVAMLNLDMVGRMRGNRLTVLGAESAAEWTQLGGAACESAKVECSLGGSGYGPSDQTPFYAAGVPVLHFFTGAHGDYHKPSDVVAQINASGAAQVSLVVAQVAGDVGRREQKLTYRKVAAPAPQGDLRSFGASLGTIPDYAGPPNGEKGMLLADVRPGGAAALAGMQRGDILIALGKHQIGSVEDLMYALNAAKPGQTVSVTVLRGGKPVKLEATFQESHRAR